MKSKNGMHKLKFRSYVWFYLGVGGCVFAIIVSAALYVWQTHYKITLTTDLIRQISDLYVNESISIEVGRGNFVHAENILERISNIDPILYGYITNFEGKIIATKQDFPVDISCCYAWEPEIKEYLLADQGRFVSQADLPQLEKKGIVKKGSRLGFIRTPVLEYSSHDLLGRLTIVWSVDDVLKSVRLASFKITILTLMVFIIALTIVGRSFSKIFSMPIEKMIQHINNARNQTNPKNILLKGLISQKGSNQIYEMELLGTELTSLLQTVISQDEKLQEEKIFSKIGQLAAQVSHDIRSPLSALSITTSDLREVPEERRLLIRSAVQRIEDIANDLASKKGCAENEACNPTEKRSTHHLTSSIQTIISEKRTEHQKKTNVKLEMWCEECAHTLFAKIQQAEFKRILSNLINNAYEAFADKGEIIVNVFEKEKMIQVSVKDSGRGIPQDKLPQLAQRGATFGKEKGQGLGLFHAKKTLELWGGSISIESQEGLGTTVTLSLPKESIPDWFASEIQVVQDQHVVILDDDESIHLVWKGRLREHGIDENHVHHFTKPDQLISWYQRLETRDSGLGALFLCDYELIGSIKTGLDVIKELGIAHQSILVTSHTEEKEIRNECKRLGIKLLPKGLAGFVPIRRKVLKCFPPKADQPLAESAEVFKLKEVDCILIDDEEIIHSTWAIVAKMKQKKIVHFNHPNEFLKAIDQYPPQTPVYIDSNFGDGIKGEVIAEEIFNKGFTEIFLTTGSLASDFKLVPWIKSVVGKEPPFMN